MSLENRTETEAIALLKNDICAICLHPAELIGFADGPAGWQVDYECEACGHCFTIFTDDKFGTQTLEFGLIELD